MYIVIFIGFLTTMTFVCICNEPQLSKDADNFNELYEIECFGETEANVRSESMII